MCSSAAGFSIFAISPARSPIRARASITSDGFRTNKRATQSTPRRKASCEMADFLHFVESVSSAVPILIIRCSHSS